MTSARRQSPVLATMLLPLLPALLVSASRAADSSDARFAERAAAVSDEARRSQAAFAKKRAARPAGAARAATAVPKAEDRYSTDCRMDDYYAYGLVSNHSRSRSLEVDGSVYFFFFDKGGTRIGNARENGSKTVWRGRTEEVQKHYYPKDTASCSFEVSEAVRWEGGGGSGGAPYSTDCSLRGGRAYGYVYNRGTETLRVSGRVTYTFYESDGDEAGSETDRPHVSIRRGEREAIGDVSAPRRAASCSLDVSEALD